MQSFLDPVDRLGSTNVENSSKSVFSMHSGDTPEQIDDFTYVDDVAFSVPFSNNRTKAEIISPPQPPPTNTTLGLAIFNAFVIVCSLGTNI